MKTVHYMCYYATTNDERNLAAHPAGTTKMTYVIQSIKKAGYFVKVFSTAPTKNRFLCHYKSKYITIDDQQSVYYIDTFGSRFKFIRFLLIFWNRIQVLKYIFLNIKENDTLLVYHSPAYINTLKIAKFFKRFYLIVEVEEIYSVATNKRKKLQREEIQYLKMVPDGYILVNDIMAKILNFNKPYIVSYSSYNLPKINGQTYESEKINVIYAGIIEKKKQGAFIAANTARYLNQKYFINILGFGQQNDLIELSNIIDEINKEKGFEIIKFHGSLRGSQYSDFLSKCHIGLSTHTMEGDFVDLSFPSKLLVYIAHNVIPVCAKIPCVLRSKISDCVVYYKDNTPESVAEAITGIDLSIKKDMRQLISDLDSQFLLELDNLIKQFTREA